MLKVFLLLALTARACLACVAERVTAEQLEQILAAAHNAPGSELTRRLATLELTARLSPARLARCRSQAPDHATQQQVTVLADVAAFLDLPPSELPAQPTPDLPAQRQMLARTVDYVSRTIHQLPNFMATRTTTSFQRGQQKPWSFRDKNSVAVIYRKGEEVTETQSSQAHGLATSGEFGPILGTVLLDAAQGNLAWSHWEQGSDGILAVFSFSVTAARSHFELAYCCTIRLSEVPVPARVSAGYQGEIAVDPVDGTIRRLMLKASLKKTDPFTLADIFVEYGQVEIGGKTYICPIRSVAYSVPGWADIGTWLNDVVFDQYHVFRSEVRIAPEQH